MGLVKESTPDLRLKIICAGENRVPLTKISKKYGDNYDIARYTWKQRNKCSHGVSLSRQSPTRPLLIQKLLYCQSWENPPLTIRQLKPLTQDSDEPP